MARKLYVRATADAVDMVVGLLRQICVVDSIIPPAFGRLAPDGLFQGDCSIINVSSCDWPDGPYLEAHVDVTIAIDRAANSVTHTLTFYLPQVP